jgi:hypothetical protein
MTQVTQLLPAVARGEPQAAAARLRLESPGHTLQPTALVHEAWMKLAGSDAGQAKPEWDGHRHFFAAAAEAMRRILVDHARRRQA